MSYIDWLKEKYPRKLVKAEGEIELEEGTEKSITETNWIENEAEKQLQEYENNY